MSESRTAFVTGSTGFLGLNLVNLLVEAGWRVVALHRPTSDLTYLQRFPVERVVGVIEEAQSIEAAMPDKVDVIFHTAADVSFWAGHRARQTRTNVEGTRYLVQAALKRKVPRFVHTSTTSVYGFATEPFDETCEHLGRGSWFNYMSSKVLAEDEVRAGVVQGLNAVMLNPANIIGPYDRHNWAKMFLLAAAGKLPRIPPGSGSFCHVVEVARAHIAAAERGQAGQNYILAGADASYREVFDIVGALLGKPVKVRVVRPRVMKAAGRVLGWVSRWTGREPLVTPESARYLTSNLLCKSDKAVRELGYQPTSLRQMFEDCHRWLGAEKLL